MSFTPIVGTETRQLLEVVEDGRSAPLGAVEIIHTRDARGEYERIAVYVTLDDPDVRVSFEVRQS